MNNLESVILRQKEIEICNDKIKKYEIKYETKQKNNCIYTLTAYLNEQLNNFSESDEIEKNILMDDIKLLSKYL